MGAGCYFPQIEDSISCATIQWPSSTKAELTAIWAGIIVCPNDRTVAIYTDSQAAIDGLTSFGQKTIRQKLASTNYNLIGDILAIKKYKDLKVKWIKVKGHSGILENDIADELATQVAIQARSNPELLIKDDNLLNNNWNFSIRWRNTNWNGNIRKNFSFFSSLFYCSDWSFNSSINRFFDSNGQNSIPRQLIRGLTNSDAIDRIFAEEGNTHIRWDILWNVFKTLKRNNRYGPIESFFNTFAIKIVNGLLPTADILAKRLPTLYNNWKCSFCNNVNEMMNHLLECLGLIDHWNRIQSLVVEIIKDY